MKEIVDSKPPFTPVSDSQGPAQPWVNRHPMLLVLASIGVGLAVAVPVGSLLGWTVYSVLAADCGTDGWCELGAAIFGLLAGMVASVVAHVVSGVVFIHRFRDPGQRWLPILIHCVVPVVLFGLLTVASGI